MVLALIATSCNKNAAPEAPGFITKTFSVTAPEGTRTELSGPTSVVWSEGDEINIIAKTSGNQYTFTIKSGAGTASAKFEGSIAETDKDETEFYALYPNVPIRIEETNDKGNRWALDLGQLVIDEAISSQQAVKEGFPVTQAYMTAVADEEGNLAFRHGAAYFKIKMPADDISSIHFQVDGGARLGGRPIYQMSDGSTFQVNGAKNYMDFTCEGGFEKDAVYYLPVLTKGSNCGNLSITFNLSTGVQAQVSTAAFAKVTLVSGRIYDLGCPPASFDPVIVADNVTIDATATSGSIAYEISNYFGTGTMTAELKEPCDWLTLGEVSEDAVYFTCSTNTGSARSASVILTYTYEGAKTVTKEIEVLQSDSSGAAATHTYAFYIDDEKNTVQTKDGEPGGTYFTVTGTSILSCSASGYFAVDSFTIKGKTYSNAKKIDGSNNISFTTSSTATTTIQFWAAKRQEDKDGIIKLQKGSSNIVNATMTLGTIYDSGIVTLEKGTEYKFNKTGEVGLFYVEVIEEL